MQDLIHFCEIIVPPTRNTVCMNGSYHAKISFDVTRVTCEICIKGVYDHGLYSKSLTKKQMVTLTNCNLTNETKRVY